MTDNRKKGLVFLKQRKGSCLSVMCVSVDVMHEACSEDLTECEVSNFLHAKPVKKMFKIKK